MAKVKDRKNLTEKTKDFLRANIWLLWIAVISSVVWDVYTDTEMRDTVTNAADKLEKVSNKISKGIVLLDLLGRPVVSQPVELTPVNPAFKQAILGYIRMYGIYDWANLTNNYTVKVRTIDDIYRFNPEVKLFRDEFFKKNSAALNDFEAYLTKMTYLISKNKLPESISVIDQKIKTFTVKNGGFNMQIDLTVQAREFNARENKIELREGHILISTDGVLDPSLGTASNPLGIQFTTKYKPTILEKKSF